MLYPSGVGLANLYIDILPKVMTLVVLVLCSIYFDLSKSEFYMLADTRFWIRYTRPVIGWVVH